MWVDVDQGPYLKAVLLLASQCLEGAERASRSPSPTTTGWPSGRSRSTHSRYNNRRQRMDVAKKDYDKAIADYNRRPSGSIPGSAFAYYNRVAVVSHDRDRRKSRATTSGSFSSWKGGEENIHKYAVLWGYFGSRRAGKAEAARRCPRRSGGQVRHRRPGPYPVIRYLRGEIDHERPARRGNRYRQDDRGPLLPGARPGPQGKGRHGQRALPLGRGARYSHLHRVHDRRGRVGAIEEGESGPREVIVSGSGRAFVV